MLEQTGTAVTEAGPRVREAMAEHAEFAEIGKRMLLAWHDGIDSLRCKRIYPMRSIDLGAPFTPFPDPKTVKAARKMVGRSGLVGRKQ